MTIARGIKPVYIYAVETFGLPGERFETHANEEWMDFEFRNEYDALIFLMGVT